MKTDKTPTVAQLQEQLAQANAQLAAQAAQLETLKEALAEALKPAEPKLNAEGRAVSPQPELMDIRTHPPTPGSRIFALGVGGVLVPAIWTKSCESFFGAWMPYPAMPPSVREWLATAWLEKQRKADLERAGKTE